VNRNPQEGEHFKHYKGGLYQVILRATHTETKEDMVVYRNLQYNTIWARPLTSWHEPVELTGEPRFVLTVVEQL
jgi:hypothetical protein